MRTLLIAMLALLLAPSLAHARGVKGSTVLRVVNNGDDILAVIVDDSGSTLTTSTSTLDAASFFRAGGRLVGSGGETFFALKAGSHTVTGAYVSSFGSNSTVSTSSSTTVTTTKNRTVTVTTSGNVTSGVTFSP